MASPSTRTSSGSAHWRGTARSSTTTAAYAAIPLLRQALRHVAHPTIRNRGTTVGSLVHGDPAAEMPAVLRLLDGWVTLRNASGTRDVAAADFFTGPMETALRPGELAVSATFRRPPPGTGTAFVEVSRRHGDYAVCGVGAVVSDGTSWWPWSAWAPGRCWST